MKRPITIIQIVAFTILFIALLSSCSRIAVPPPRGDVPSSGPVGDVLNGLASWYGEDFHGRLTSNKEIYDMYAMTAAHKSLPFNTHVRVTNLQNNRSCVVRINDRGPFVGERIIDMSYAGACALDMVVSGVIPVRVEVLPQMSPPPGTQKFIVQVGSFIERGNADRIRNQLKPQYKSVTITKYRTPDRLFYRVRINTSGYEEAQFIMQCLFKEGIRAYVLEEYTQ